MKIKKMMKTFDAFNCFYAEITNLWVYNGSPTTKSGVFNTLDNLLHILYHTSKKIVTNRTNNLI
jgi:Zn-dependent peptidase ImmA (M78 family)